MTPPQADERWAGSEALHAWAFVRQMLDEMTTMVTTDAETELELVEGLRVLARASALCAELSLDIDVEAPWFFDMNTEARYIGGPNPDGEYHLAMIDGQHRYRVRGTRGTVCYLGFQVLAGTGMTPRRMGAYVSDRDLALDDDGSFALVIAPTKPTEAELRGAQWVEVPDDASAIVVRQYIADRALETPAELAIETLETPGPAALPTDTQIAAQLTAMAWTIAKLTTLHRTIRPDLIDAPNALATAGATDLGDADTTPDNLYMIGTYRLDPGEALVIDIEPPDTRYWSVTIENIWHECLDVRRRKTSLTNAHATRQPDGSVQVVVAAEDPDAPNWLDTGGRHRGWVLLRWLDNPSPPTVRTSVVGVRQP